MASDPSWDDIFGPASNPPATDSATPAPGAASRRALRDAESQRRRAREQRRAEREPRRPDRERRRGRAKWVWIVSIVAFFALAIGGCVAVWVMYEDRIREVLGIEAAYDYTGSGNGEEVVVVIQPGEIGSDIARTLAASGVTMSHRAFYELLLANPDVHFEPGSYRLQGEMSAQAALDALRDPENRLQNRVTIPEGTTAGRALELIAAGTEIPIEELQTQAANFTQFGVPADAPNIEGYLFPATYTFDPGTTATGAIQLLVDTMIEKLDAAGVPEERRFEVLNMAALVQRESGPNVDDMAKIARVFVNRLDRGMLLQSDATVHYGIGDTSSVWTNPEDRADASNPYNTYANPGLPIGPIGLPGEDAIRAAVTPAEGTWLYFVTVDLRTGETIFSNTLGEHERAARQLFAWCNESAENDAYCA